MFSVDPPLQVEYVSGRCRCGQCVAARPMHVAAFAFLAPLASRQQTAAPKQQQQQQQGSVFVAKEYPATRWLRRPYAASTSTSFEEGSGSRSPWWSRSTGWLHRRAGPQISSPRCGLREYCDRRLRLWCWCSCIIQTLSGTLEQFRAKETCFFVFSNLRYYMPLLK